jgi:pyruvate/2-oxoglutarate dehydrogenase complex dihydrolipoamide dehydrogenase (E3) component
MVVGQLTMETEIAVIGGGPGGYVAAINYPEVALGLPAHVFRKKSK